MRSALRRLLAHSPGPGLYRNAVCSDGILLCKQVTNGALKYSGNKIECQRSFSNPSTFQDEEPEKASETSKPVRRVVDRPGEVDHDLEYISDLQDFLLESPDPTTIEECTKIRGVRKRWSDRCSTFEETEYESDLTAPPSKYTRLVDLEEYATDWDLWLELVNHRKRNHGNEGAIIIWREMMKRKLELPTDGTTGSEIWDGLVLAGQEEPRFLEEIVTYAKWLRTTTGREVPMLYPSVMSNCLKTDPKSALAWHLRLKEEFPPDLEAYKRLFKVSVQSHCLFGFTKLYNDLPLRGLYGTIVEELCNKRLHTFAVSWHKRLLKGGDRPSSFSDTKPLFVYYIQTGNRKMVTQLALDIVVAKVELPSFVEKHFVQRKSLMQETMDRELGEDRGTVPRSLSDGFCARLFATKLLGVEMVIEGLRVMGLKALGPLALREMAARDDSQAEIICRHFDLLKDAGISVNGSRFSVVIRKFANENKSKLLRSVVDSDLHPDTFDDYNLQQSLLAEYVEKKDQIKIERTLAVLTVSRHQGTIEEHRWNLILRAHIRLGNKDAGIAVLEKMRSMNITLSETTSRHLRVFWLSRRQVGRRPLGTRELGLIMNVMKYTLESGSNIPLVAWRELLRRLGMTGDLIEVQNLSFYLIDWYSNGYSKPIPDVSDSKVGRAIIESISADKGFLDKINPPEQSPILSSYLEMELNGRTELDRANLALPKEKITLPQDHLHVIFTTSYIHAVVTWGFQQPFKNLKTLRTKQPANKQIRWTWGLELLLALRERGVYIPRATIAKCCKDRLDQLFGPVRSNKRINRRVQEHNDRRARAMKEYSYQSYVRKMEELWGKRLFYEYPVVRAVSEFASQKSVKRPEMEKRKDML